MRAPSAAVKYLEHYAEPEIQLLENLPLLTDIRHLLAIPCYDEPVDFVQRLLQAEFQTQGRSLIILIVNQPIGVSCIRNQELIRHFQQWHKVWSNASLSLFKDQHDRYDWIVCDQTQPGIDPREGVGKARKIAGDIACWLWLKQRIATDWLHCSDADAHLPSNYFEPITGDYSAITFAHKHLNNPQDDAVSNASHTYEQALDYYLQGLRWAGSPYAFNTIGSTLAVNILRYCQVRGFPKRNAAEDFYLLNKLAKIKPVAENLNICVNIESRLSQRVPFGTGPAVAKIIELQQLGQDYTYYAPECFMDLRSWLNHVPLFAECVRTQHPPMTALNTAITTALEAAGIDKVIDHIQQQHLNKQQALNAIQHWFDGFRTLKFLRFLQHHFYPPQPLAALYQSAPFV